MSPFTMCRVSVCLSIGNKINDFVQYKNINSWLRFLGNESFIGTWQMSTLNLKLIVVLPLTLSNFLFLFVIVRKQIDFKEEENSLSHTQLIHTQLIFWWDVTRCMHFCWCNIYFISLKIYTTEKSYVETEKSILNHMEIWIYFAWWYCGTRCRMPSVIIVRCALNVQCLLQFINIAKGSIVLN